MEQYLIDHGTLAKLVDMLLVQKYPDEPPANINELREDGIRKLDDQIGAKVFGGLDEKQLKELNNLLDDQEKDPTVFQDFFNKNNINLGQIITETMQDFSKEFLGGKND